MWETDLLMNRLLNSRFFAGLPRKRFPRSGAGVIPLPDEEDDDDWSKYASAGFGAAYDPWADLVPLEDEDGVGDEIDIDDDGFHISMPPPSEEGFDQLVKMGACDHCLARLSGRVVETADLAVRGADVRQRASARGSTVDEDVEYCPFCEDLFCDLGIVTDIVTAELKELEFKRLQIASHFAKDHVVKEDELRTHYGATGSPALKTTYNEALATSVASMLSEVEIVKDNPEVMVLVDTLTLQPKVEVRSLYLYGRYRKLERGIPQTRWPCRACKGRDGGCEMCEGSGQQYPTNVQDEVGEPLRAAYQARDTAFHGMGREDIDVRCLGRGRPFVIEMKAPMRRYADLVEMTDMVNATSAGCVEISELRPSRRSEVARIKGTAAEKSYTIRFRIGSEVHSPAGEKRGCDKPRRGGAGENPSEQKELSGEGGSGDQAGGESARAQVASGDQVGGESESGDQAGGDGESGDQVGGESESGDQAGGGESSASESESQFDADEASGGAPLSPPKWSDEEVRERISSLAGVTLVQQTPQRVAHRRADKARKRKVVAIENIIVEGDEAQMDVRVESGTYVKELVHSDEGRTTPSVAEQLGLVCEVVWLDVNDVHAD